MVSIGSLKIPVRCKAPWPDDITCGDIIASRPTTAPPSIGRKAGFTRSLANSTSQAATPRISAIPNTAATKPTPPVGRKNLRGQVADQGRHADRRQRCNRIAADDQLEAVKGAAQGRPESAGNGAGGAATDQHAHIGAAQTESLADLRGEAASELGIASFQADRSADAARPYGLRRHDQAAAERHTPAVQRIGFDRVDFGAASPRDIGRHQAEQQTAEARRGKGIKRIERDLARQSLAGIEPEKCHVHERDRFAHGGNHQAGDGTGYNCQHDHARFTSAYNGAQTMRNFERSIEPGHKMQDHVRQACCCLEAKPRQRASCCFPARPWQVHDPVEAGSASR
jgi:hypothetical protein